VNLASALWRDPVVEQIVEQFRFLIEDRRFSEELYHAGKPRPERAAQRLFFAVAHAYCKANNLDLTPEADTGNGPVDFKVSSGFTGRVLVEIKLSTNGKLVKGYSRQLETYKTAEETLKGYYVVLDVGQMGEKAKSLTELRNAASARGEKTSPVIFIDGRRRLSASKL
jgi:glutaredoxin